MKTVFTLGPASEEKNLIKSLYQVADRFRLNVAHLSSSQLRDWLDNLMDIFEKIEQKSPVILDLQGAKMRIGDYPTTTQIPEKVTLIYASDSQTVKQIPVPHQDLFCSLQAEDILSLNEGRVQLKVLHAHDDYAEALVLSQGKLSAYKGINRVNHPIPFSQLTEKDEQAIQIGLDYPLIQFACSFVLTGQEVFQLRPLVTHAHLIAKLERPEAMKHLREIDHLFDELWFCRGDMGEQAGLKALGALQAHFVAAFDQLSRPKFIAGQLLEHMTHFPRPTRSEIVHLYDVKKAGFDGIVLSDETAIGCCPIKVAEFVKYFFDKSDY